MSRRAADLIGQIIRRADALSANTTLAPSVALRLARLVSVHVPAPATLCTVRCPQRIRIRRDAALQLSRAVRQLQYRSRHYRATRHLRSGDGKEKGSLLNGVKEWKVKFDGSALHFPNHRIPKRSSRSNVTRRASRNDCRTPPAKRSPLQELSPCLGGISRHSLRRMGFWR